MRGNRNLWIVRALFLIYLYSLFKIIVLKFHQTDIAFLWERLQTNLSHPEYIVARIQTGNLVPLREISRTIQTMTDHSFINLLGDIIIFIPLGLFLGILGRTKKQRPVEVFWRSLALSLGLEFTQVLLTIGTFDVDDLLVNCTPPKRWELLGQ